jgi:hypothetical protein
MSIFFKLLGKLAVSGRRLAARRGRGRASFFLTNGGTGREGRGGMCYEQFLALPFRMQGATL